MGLIQDVPGTPKPTAIGVAAPGVKSQLMTTGAQVGRQISTALGWRFDPAPAYLFYVELSGVIVALFTECSGLSVTREVEEVVEGGVNDHVHKLPGRVRYSNITLKRGLSLSRALWDWFQEGRYDFHTKRINFSIFQGAPGYNLASVAGMGSEIGKVKHWDVEDAYPVRWEISALDTSSRGVVIETLEIAHHGLTLSYEAATPFSIIGTVMGMM